MIQYENQKKIISFILQKIIRNSVWACIIMEQIVIYLSMVQKLLNSLCLRNISKQFSIDDMKNTGLNGYVYEFGVDSSI